jgi:hypothetical protein
MYKFVYIGYLLLLQDDKTHINVFNFLFVIWINIISFFYD